MSPAWPGARQTLTGRELADVAGHADEHARHLHVVPTLHVDLKHTPAQPTHQQSPPHSLRGGPPHSAFSHRGPFRPVLLPSCCPRSVPTPATVLSQTTAPHGHSSHLGLSGVPLVEKRCPRSLYRTQPRGPPMTGHCWLAGVGVNVLLNGVRQRGGGGWGGLRLGEGRWGL